MVDVKKISAFLDKELKVKSIRDNSKNGLQVKAKNKIFKVGFAVDASISTFELARKNKVDLLIVHHGIYWKGHKDKAGLQKKRVEFLKKHKINLYACHLPLDLHPKFGNNTELAKIVGLINLKKFGRYNGKLLGLEGKLKKTLTINNIAGILNRNLRTRCIKLAFGKSKIKTIGIVSGGGSFAFTEAVLKNLDCFVTGEAKHELHHAARDLRQNVILGGHYQTETVGVKAIRSLLHKRFNLDTIFLNNPTLI